MILFQGYEVAAQRELKLKTQVAQIKSPIAIAAIVFREDVGSMLYTRLKKEAAGRVGIGYQTFEYSMMDDISIIRKQIEMLGADPAITGIIIQKPWKVRWAEVTQRPADEFANWWRQLVETIAVNKDVDGLHPETLRLIDEGKWQEKGKVLPATCRAVLVILDEAIAQLNIKQPTELKVAMIGKSDLLGRPLAAVLKQRGHEVTLLGSKELQARRENQTFLTEFPIVVSATGRASLITGELLGEQTIIIDAGEPKGDVERSSVESKAAFLTPVPGGVGPMTVVCLLENAVQLITNS